MTNETVTPLTGDKLNRRQYADGLIGFITRIDKGVIAIDGEWGVGKSWLGENLKLMVEQADMASTLWIDAFDADWDDDPSLSLIAGISSITSESTRTMWLENAASFLARLIPVGTKAVARVAANAAGINQDTIDDLSSAIRDESSAFIESRLKDLADKKNTLVQLKKILDEAVRQAPQKKLVVFIDELDRCSPEYAIRFLERLKHLFDLDGVVYVLFWNRSQIQRAVETFYGSGTDGQMYLDKFIDIPLNLQSSHVTGSSGPMRGLIESLGERLGLNQIEQSSLYENLNLLNSFATLLRFTARESERLARWWVMSPNRSTIVLETWLLALKVRRPDLFANIRDGKTDAHLKVKEFINSLRPDENISHIIAALSDIHDRYQRDDFEGLNQDVEVIFGRGYTHRCYVLPAAIRRLETFN